MNASDIGALKASGGKEEAIAWLRNVLITMLDISPIPKWLRQPTAHLILRVPDWLLAAWASAVEVDYMNAYRICPDLAEKVRSDTGKQSVGDFLETHHVVPMARSLRQVVRIVLRFFKLGKLPTDTEKIERGVAGLALADCTPLGNEFVKQASSILISPEETDHLLRRYQLLLERAEEQKLKDMDSALTSSCYGDWVANRLGEAKRWLFGTIEFRIQFGERIHRWDSLWKNILLGGKNGR